ncbi:Glycosyltransferase [Citrobacter sedlakii]|uniref:glycosyltransferase family 2 protein n=1 Tax=Citrobacter sedlakii TaxID=67826 RepID=UPI003B24030D
MNNECVSIIMPVYNGSKTILKSIDSILKQTFEDYHLYVIDDHSTDSTYELLMKAYSENNKITILRNVENRGVAFTRNVGIKNCSGKYIAFCDADDLWHSEKLNKQINLLETSSIDVVCSNYQLIDKNDSVVGVVKQIEEIDYKKMLNKNHIGNLTGIYNVSKIGKVYQKNIGHEDYLMWLEILTKTNKAICMQENLAMYRITNSSLSSNKINAAKWTWVIYRKHLRLSIIKSLCCFINYALSGVIRKLKKS